MNSPLTLTELEARQWDVTVVGAGPAGALAARSLALQGYAVLLLDKAAFPRNKVCGGCINRRAQQALADAGLEDLLYRLGAANLDSLILAAGSYAASIRIPGYLGVSRATLDEALVVEAVSSGAMFSPKTRVLSSEPEADGRIVHVNQNDAAAQIRSRIVIAANGLGGAPLNKSQKTTPASRIGAGTILCDAPDYYRPNKIYMACGSGGYVGLTRVEDGLVDIAAAFDPVYIRSVGGLGPAAANVFEEAGFPVWEGLMESDWRGTPALTRSSTNVTAERLFVIGDAAGYVEPFTGEGIACAVTTGLAVAEIVGEAAKKYDESFERSWRNRYQRTVSRRLYICSTMTHALRHPRFTTTAVRLLSRMPALARPIISRLNAPTPIQKSV